MAAIREEMDVVALVQAAFGSSQFVLPLAPGPFLYLRQVRDGSRPASGGVWEQCHFESYCARYENHIAGAPRLQFEKHQAWQCPMRAKCRRVLLMGAL